MKAETGAGATFVFDHGDFGDVDVKAVGIFGR